MAKLTFNVTYKIDGKDNKTTMEYDTKDAVATLERRLKTAFPHATSIVIEAAK